MVPALSGCTLRVRHASSACRAQHASSAVGWILCDCCCAQLESRECATGSAGMGARGLDAQQRLQRSLQYWRHLPLGLYPVQWGWRGEGKAVVCMRYPGNWAAASTQWLRTPNGGPAAAEPPHQQAREASAPQVAGQAASPSQLTVVDGPPATLVEVHAGIVAPVAVRGKGMFYSHGLGLRGPLGCSRSRGTIGNSEPGEPQRLQGLIVGSLPHRSSRVGQSNIGQHGYCQPSCAPVRKPNSLVRAGVASADGSVAHRPALAVLHALADGPGLLPGVGGTAGRAGQLGRGAGDEVADRAGPLAAKGASWGAARGRNEGTAREPDER